jgi:hypothetical protein
MNAKNVEFYEKGSNRANQRIWAAAGAALHALIDHDPESLRFQNQVWREAINGIDEQGYATVELGRGQQAFTYNLYSFSATLMLRAAREALGYKTTPAENKHLKLMADKMAKLACDESEIDRLAQTAQQMPNVGGYQVIYAFANDLGADWARCAPQTTKDADYFARGFGGDTRHSFKVLKQSAR